MNTVFKKLSVTALGIVALFATAVAKTPNGWVDDVEAAFVQAENENKKLLLLFTGSDYCPPCIVMDKKVFSKEEFVSKATKDFVLVFIDFPESDPELDKANTKYFDKYSILELPTVILMDPKESEFGRFSAIDYPGVDLFLTRIDELKERSELD